MKNALLLNSDNYNKILKADSASRLESAFFIFKIISIRLATYFCFFILVVL